MSIEKSLPPTKEVDYLKSHIIIYGARPPVSRRRIRTTKATTSKI